MNIYATNLIQFDSLSEKFVRESFIHYCFIRIMISFQTKYFNRFSSKGICIHINSPLCVSFYCLIFIVNRCIPSRSHACYRNPGCTINDCNMLQLQLKQSNMRNAPRLS